MTSDANREGLLQALNDQVIACTRCPRLVAYREEAARVKKRAFQDQEYWGRPVPSLGDPAARVMLVGLAPAAHGSNRTGRMFTGDGTDGMGAGDFLMRALYNTGFVNQPYSRAPDDGLLLFDLYISAAVRCAPPDNKPLPAEIENCRPYMQRELDLLSNLRVVVALGRLAFDQMLRNYLARGVAFSSRPRFAHGAIADAGPALPVLLASYHPSRQNTQTGVLKPYMLEEIFRTARQIAESPK
jgi:uracil-DNA glycosylase family 4